MDALIGGTKPWQGGRPLNPFTFAGMPIAAEPQAHAHPGQLLY
jgi:hypothetical protein